MTKPVLPKPLSLKDSLSARLPRSRSVTDRDVSGLTVIMGVTSSAPSASVKAGDKPFIPPVNGSTTYRYFSNGRKKELKNSLDIGSLPFYHPSHDHPLQLSRWFKGLWVRLVPPSLSLADGARNVTTLPVPNPKWRIAILGKVSTSVPMCSPPPLPSLFLSAPLFVSPVCGLKITGLYIFAMLGVRHERKRRQRPTRSPRRATRDDSPSPISRPCGGSDGEGPHALHSDYLTRSACDYGDYFDSKYV